MRLPWLDPGTPFPPAHLALDDPPGLLAAGGDLSPDRLRQAYSQGIFPWFSEGQPLLWWSPDPRMILRTTDFHPSHSLRKRLRKIARAWQQGDQGTSVRVDTAFGAVIRACARKSTDDQPGTWITAEMIRAYERLHREGHAHSIETWIDGELAGGLYGVCLGRMFFGESMFARATDASKIALAYLVRFLALQGVAWIDCQMETGHLASLGAAPVPRTEFLAHVRQAVNLAPVVWRSGYLDPAGILHDPAPGKALPDPA